MLLGNPTIKFTNRTERIMRNAEKEANQNVLHPLHLLIACLKEKGGAFGEIHLKSLIKQGELHVLSEQLDLSSFERKKSEFFYIPITEDVERVMEAAITYMKKYNQIYLNEGHLLKALLMSHTVDDYISQEDRNLLLNLGTTARDMITHLGNYTFPDNLAPGIRKVSQNDKQSIIKFVETNFSKAWAETVRGAFWVTEPSIYIALNHNEDIIGFAAYDVYMNKKCYFGPMGVSKTNRTKGVGYSVLHHCLRDMKEIGYEYAIIGGAGPIEFYEKACAAVIIPSTY